MIISKAFLIAVGDNPNTSAVEALASLFKQYSLSSYLKTFKLLVSCTDSGKLLNSKGPIYVMCCAIWYH